MAIATSEASSANDGASRPRWRMHSNRHVAINISVPADIRGLIYSSIDVLVFVDGDISVDVPDWVDPCIKCSRPAWRDISPEGAGRCA